ncbi:MAG: alanine racemase [Candidatus Aminicenantia bacterium]
MKRRNFLKLAGLSSLGLIAKRNFEGKELSDLEEKENKSCGSLDPWIEVDLKHIAWNLSQIRRLVQVPIMAVVKANAYGHGLVKIAKFLEKNGINYLMVGKCEEAVELRKNGVRCPILNFGPFSKEDCLEIIKLGISQSVFTDQALALNEIAARLKKKAKVHIHFDTGLGRVGIPHYQAIPFIEKVSSLSHLMIEGISTTLTEDKDFDQEQLRRFFEMCGSAQRKGIALGLRHVASSDGILNHPQSYLDMVRPGITIYGYYPSPQTQREDRLKLKPALKFKAKVVFIKDLLPGESLSYHRKFTAREKELIATVGVGYSDGYPYQLADRAEIVIKNKKYPVIAAVTANHLMVNLKNDREIKIGDEVVLISDQRDRRITADELAALAGTSVYKILIGLNPLLPRRYIK